MLCEKCKIREASIQYTEVINGVKTEHHYCSQCAKEVDFGPYSAIFDGDFPLGKLLSGLLGMSADEEETESAPPQIICPTCKTSYAEFVKNNRFGCPDCYSVFDLLIGDYIKKLQGSETHRGKKPGRFARIQPAQTRPKEDEAVPQTADPIEPDDRIRILEARLRGALAREDYETAAKCRDEIREIRAGRGSASI